MEALIWIDRLLENDYGKVLIWLTLILILMAVDIATGFIQAIVNRDIKSQKMSNGLLKKLALLLVLITIVPLTILLPDVISVSVIIGVYIIETFNEIVSILENLKKLGIATDMFAPIIQRLSQENNKDKNDVE